MRSSSWTAAASSPRGRRGACCTSTSRKCCWSYHARSFQRRRVHCRSTSSRRAIGCRSAPTAWKPRCAPCRRRQCPSPTRTSARPVSRTCSWASPARSWANDQPAAVRQPVTGAAVRYVDWLLPGILGMNMMFSCLFGVGYVVLRYRKSGFLKRLHATPLPAFEFLSAQVLSRLGLILFVTAILYAGIGAVIGFHNAGNLLLLALLGVVGALSMIALGLTIAARFSSEELVGGLLNVLTWPMMLLSGIWFSLEGSPRWVQWVAHVFPLTHVLDAARAVMLDGAGLPQIAPNLLYLAATAFAFLAFGAWSFRWRIE